MVSEKEGMTGDELQEIVFSVLEEYGKVEGRRVLMQKLKEDARFREAATCYGMELLGLVLKSEH